MRYVALHQPRRQLSLALRNHDDWKTQVIITVADEPSAMRTNWSSVMSRLSAIQRHCNGMFKRNSALHSVVNKAWAYIGSTCFRCYRIDQTVFVHRFVRWGTQSPCNAPSEFVEPLTNERTRYSGLCAPIADQQPFAIELKKTIGSFVSRLGFDVSPTHIAGFVIAAVVDSINRKATGARPHVIGKRLEGLPPFVANGNTARPVHVELGVIRVMASLNHACP